jgi:hypothetical protein
MSKQVSFVIDDETVELIEQLKKDLHARTTESLFRKALALTQLAVRQVKDESGRLRDPKATVTLRASDRPGPNETSVALRG